MAKHSLLPPNTSPLERNLEQAMRFDLPVPIRELWSIEDCPDHLLPWLGWSLGVDFWHLADTPRKRRDLIKNALSWHKKRGTPWAIKQALATLGYQVEELIEQGEYKRQWEQAGGRFLDGSWDLSEQKRLYWDPGLPGYGLINSVIFNHWADYAIRLYPVDGWSRADQIAVHRIAQQYAPTRSRLVSVLSSVRVRFSSPVTHSIRYSAQLGLNKCRGFSVFDQPLLTGCWQLGGSSEPNTLTGWQLDPFIPLSGTRPVSGFTWATGQMSVKITCH
jgi:phage tail P2-like protein